MGVFGSYFILDSAPQVESDFVSTRHTVMVLKQKKSRIIYLNLTAYYHDYLEADSRSQNKKSREVHNVQCAYDSDTCSTFSLPTSDTRSLLVMAAFIF